MSLCWVAVMTETSSGIGAAVAHSLASALARVALAARRQYELLAVQAGLDGQGDEVRGLVAATDVTEQEQVGSLVACRGGA